MSKNSPWPDALLRIMFRPRIVHSTPGRVRIRLPVLRRVPADSRNVIDSVIALIRVPGEICEVERHPASDRVLIHFDGDRATAQDVLAFLDALFEVYLNNREVLHDVPADRWPGVETKLADLVRTSVHRRLTLNPNLEITADVLA
jgi:hypothetical protein